MRFQVLLAVFLAALVCGCETGHEQPAVAPNPVVTAPPPPPASSDQSDEQLVRFQKDYELAKTAYQKNPASKEAKEAYVISTVRLGTATMVSPALESKVKYPGALRLYREALKVDPTNEEAVKNKDQIEAIYKQLGRPIPQ